MSLEGIVKAAKLNATAIKPSLDEGEKHLSTPMDNSISAAVEAVESSAGQKRISWQDCRHMRMGYEGTPLCSQFMGRCAREKCKSKFMKL